MREYDVKIFAIVKSPLPCEAMPAAVAKVRSGPKTGVQRATEYVSICTLELLLEDVNRGTHTKHKSDAKEQTEFGRYN